MTGKNVPDESGWFQMKRKYIVLKKYVCKMNNVLNKQLCVFFPPIDSSHYSVYKSIKVQLSKN